MRTSTKANAQNRWRGILGALGFTGKELSGDHGPCPICLGVDRFRFTDYRGGGEYFCSGCGAGAGFDLIMKRDSCDFLSAAKEVDRVLGTDIKEVFRPKVNLEKRRKDLNALWAKGTVPFVLSSYMRARGITTPMDGMCNLRGITNMYLKGTVAEQNGILALIRDPGGQPVSIHRTYIDEKIRKIMPPSGDMRGSSVRLGTDPEGDIVVGEGIETTLAGMQYYGVESGMAAISAHGMETLVLPKKVERVIILADNDKSFTGQKAAFTLARHYDSKGLSVSVVMSYIGGCDFNDILNDVSGTLDTSSDIMEFEN